MRFPVKVVLGTRLVATALPPSPPSATDPPTGHIGGKDTKSFANLLQFI